MEVIAYTEEVGNYFYEPFIATFKGRRGGKAERGKSQ